MAAVDSGHSPRLEDIPAQCCTYDDLFARIRRGHLLVTGNSRLARYIKHAYDLWRMEQGDKNWPAAMIRPWDRWLDELWESAVLQGIDGAIRAVPGRRQLLSLWQHALQHAQVQHGLLNPASLASIVRQARPHVLLLDLFIEPGFDALSGVRRLRADFPDRKI